MSADTPRDRAVGWAVVRPAGTPGQRRKPNGRLRRALFGLLVLGLVAWNGSFLFALIDQWLVGFAPNRTGVTAIIVTLWFGGDVLMLLPAVGGLALWRRQDRRAVAAATTPSSP